MPAILVVDVVKVPVDGAHVDAKLVRNFLGVRPSHEMQHYLGLAPGEVIGSPGSVNATGEFYQPAQMVNTGDARPPRFHHHDVRRGVQRRVDSWES